MTLSEEDFFILTRTIRGIQERIDDLYKLHNEKINQGRLMLEEFDGMMEGLIDVCNELRNVRYD